MYYQTLLRHLVYVASLARIIVYSMSPDGIPTPGSTVSTPMMTPMASGASTPVPHQYTNGSVNGALADYLSAPLSKGHAKAKTYIGGSRALDSLAKFIAATEGFFHPTNSGNWTNDVSFTCIESSMFICNLYPLQLSAFVKYIVFDFNKRKRLRSGTDPCTDMLHCRVARRTTTRL